MVLSRSLDKDVFRHCTVRVLLNKLALSTELSFSYCERSKWIGFLLWGCRIRNAYTRNQHLDYSDSWGWYGRWRGSNRWPSTQFCNCINVNEGGGSTQGKSKHIYRLSTQSLSNGTHQLEFSSSFATTRRCSLVDTLGLRRGSVAIMARGACMLTGKNLVLQTTAMRSSLTPAITFRKVEGCSAFNQIQDGVD